MISMDTHDAFASVPNDNACFPLFWMNPHNFNLMARAKRKAGIRGFPVYATISNGILYAWPINDGSAKIWWQPKTWRKP